MPKSVSKCETMMAHIVDMKSIISYMHTVLQGAGHETLTAEERLELDRAVGRYLKAVNRYNEAAKIEIKGEPEGETSQ